MALPEFTKKNVLYIAFFTTLLSAIFTITLFGLSSKHPKSTSIKEKLSNFVSNSQDEKPDSDINILIMGYGGVGHPGGGLVDANILISLNKETKIISLIAIPRDLWVPIPLNGNTTENFKINAAFPFGNDDERYPNKIAEFKGRHGGGNLAKAVVENVTGLKVDYYAVIDFDRFVNAIDALNKITVDVPVAFTDKFFPVPGREIDFCGMSNEDIEEAHEKYTGFKLESQFECRYETLEFSKGLQAMDGETALKFIRSRHSATQGSDFSRGVRTQAVLIGIKNKLLSLDAINKIDDFYEQFRKFITTDIGQKDIISFLGEIPNIDEFDVQKINITNKNYLETTRSSNGQEILIPKAGENNFEEIKQFILENI